MSQTSPNPHQKIIERAAEIIAQNIGCGTPEGSEPYCVLALIDDDGSPTASTITAAKASGIREITFDTGLTSNKVRRIAKCNRASVCFCSPTYNITLVGHIETVTDPQVKKDMWYAGMGQLFSGPEDPGYCVLRFTTERYNLFVDFQEAAGTL